MRGNRRRAGEFFVVIAVLRELVVRADFGLVAEFVVGLVLSLHSCCVVAVAELIVSGLVVYFE